MGLGRISRAVVKAYRKIASRDVRTSLSVIQKNAPFQSSFNSDHRPLVSFLGYNQERQTLTYQDYYPEQSIVGGVDPNVSYLRTHFASAAYKFDNETVVHVPPKGYFGYPAKHMFVGVTPRDLKKIANLLKKQ